MTFQFMAKKYICNGINIILSNKFYIIVFHEKPISVHP
jgi:hypothetical protein